MSKIAGKICEEYYFQHSKLFPAFHEFIISAKSGKVCLNNIMTMINNDSVVHRYDSNYGSTPTLV